MHPRRFSQPTTSRRIRPAMALAALGACFVLAACGSSASSSTGTASTGSTASSNGPQAPGSSRFTALRTCMQKQGITLPAPSGKRPPAGSGGPGGGGLLGGGGGRGLQPPAGVSTTQFQEALKKCGRGGFGGGARFNSAASKAALTKFVACMRENGINLPTPNTSGKGPVFNTSAVNTASSTFKAAQGKCQGTLQGAFGGGPRGGANAGSGPPPAEGGTPPAPESEPNG